MVYPKSIAHRIKYAFWRVYTPLHPYVRDAALRVGITWHEPGRQPFCLGKLAPEYSLQDVVLHLIANGYGNYFVAWRDDDEILSMRKTQNFVYQYHLRIYADGEIRGHYEYTPECHPIRHIQEVGLENRREHFLELLGEHIVFSDL